MKTRNCPKQMFKKHALLYEESQAKHFGIHNIQNIDSWIHQAVPYMKCLELFCCFTCESYHLKD